MNSSLTAKVTWVQWKDLATYHRCMAMPPKG